MRSFWKFFFSTLMLLNDTVSSLPLFDSSLRSLPLSTLPTFHAIKFEYNVNIGSLRAKYEDKDEDRNYMLGWDPSDEDSEKPEIIIRGSENDTIDGSIWEDLETGQPPQWMVVKELLGINIFTYIFGALIVFFMGMNYIIGPGWLGDFIGLPGTGAIQEVSKSLPDTVDLSSPEFRL